MEKQAIDSMILEPARIKWACRRGMLELDVLLGNFFENAYPMLSDDNKRLFIELLDNTDPELFSWLLGQTEPADPRLQTIVTMVRKHAVSRF